MGVDMLDLGRVDTGLAQRLRHGAAGAAAIFQAGGEMVGIGAGAITHQLGQGRGAPCCATINSSTLVVWARTSRSGSAQCFSSVSLRETASSARISSQAQLTTTVQLNILAPCSADVVSNMPRQIWISRLQRGHPRRSAPIVRQASGGANG